MPPRWTNLALSSEQDAYNMHNPAIAEPGFMCLYPDCEWTFPNGELLENHVATHFNIPLPANVPTNGLPSFGGLVSASNSYNAYDPIVNMAGAQPQSRSPATTSTPNGHLGHAILAPTPSNNRIGRPRSTCTTCNKTFSRRSDLERHAKKHQPNMLIYHCSAQDCDYEGSYRKDKLEAHVKSCH